MKFLLATLMISEVNFFTFILLSLCIHGRCALVNITVQETSPQIVYNGNNWVKNEASPIYSGGFHAQTQDLSASAVFNFTGVGIYYYVSLWRFNVSTKLILDGHDIETLNLTSPESPNADPDLENSTIRWSRTNLKDGPHSLVISPGNFVLVDALTFTQNHSDTPSTFNSTSSFQNVTVEETSSQIAYNGDNWVKSEADSLYHDGTQAKNQDVSANAVFTFTGNAVYYFGALFPYRVTTVLSLDGGAGDTVDLTDPAVPNQDAAPPTVQSAIRWSRQNLTYGNHTLTISAGSHAIVDAITYTQDLSVSSNSSDSGQFTPPPSSSPRSNTALVGGLVGGVLGFLLIIAIIVIIHLYRRRQRPNPQVTQDRATHGPISFTLRRNQTSGQVSPYTFTSSAGLFVDTMMRSRNLSEEPTLGMEMSPTATVAMQTTRKGAYTGRLPSVPRRDDPVQWEAPPPSYRG